VHFVLMLMLRPRAANDQHDNTNSKEFRLIHVVTCFME
jgi:hypothetical protein